MAFDWVPLQIFMAADSDEPRFFEVSFKPVTRELVCTCPGWRLRRDCRHVRFVQRWIDIEGGYSPPFPNSRALPALTDEVKQDPEKYRRWFYTNTGVLMLTADGRMIKVDGPRVEAFWKRKGNP